MKLLDHFPLENLVQPRSTLEVGQAVIQAAATGLAIYPLGGRTMLGVGLLPTRRGIGVDLRGLDEVIDYPARDLTITVQAGITLARLASILAAEGQCLPVDVPRPEQATLGGALATNTSGPRRLGHGTLRDYVLGISAINDVGQEFKAGGRVVKNVAGYDLCKLMIGSLGTLGIITQATLKLKPLPETRAVVAFVCDEADLGPSVDRVAETTTRPIAVMVLNQPAVRRLRQRLRTDFCVEPDRTGKQWVLLIGYEDNATAVSWQVAQIQREMPSAGVKAIGPCGVQESLAVVKELSEMALDDDVEFTLKISTRPHLTAGHCLHLEKMEPEARIVAHAGNGIIHLYGPADLTHERAQKLCSEVGRVAEDEGGNAVVQGCPTGWASDLPIWGRPRGDLALMRAIKEKFDPRCLFNPGRFVGGI